jgi:hypothetical protein
MLTRRSLLTTTPVLLVPVAAAAAPERPDWRCTVSAVNFRTRCPSPTTASLWRGYMRPIIRKPIGGFLVVNTYRGPKRASRMAAEM